MKFVNIPKGMWGEDVNSFVPQIAFNRDRNGDYQYAVSRGHKAPNAIFFKDKSYEIGKYCSLLACHGKIYHFHFVNAQEGMLAGSFVDGENIPFITKFHEADSWSINKSENTRLSCSPEWLKRHNYNSLAYANLQPVYSPVGMVGILLQAGYEYIAFNWDDNKKYEAFQLESTRQACFQEGNFVSIIGKSQLGICDSVFKPNKLKNGRYNPVEIGKAENACFVSSDVVVFSITSVSGFYLDAIDYSSTEPIWNCRFRGRCLKIIPDSKGGVVGLTESGIVVAPSNNQIDIPKELGKPLDIFVSPDGCVASVLTRTCVVEIDLS